MSNIAKAFENGKAFIGFVTGGDPCVEKTKEFVLEMFRAGADLVEIGIPFSDPIAEGPVIQEANIRALSAGTTVGKLFTLVEGIRKETAKPLLFMTYLNPVFHYGYDAFFKRAAAAGLDGIIVPDLPHEEQAPVREAASKYGVDLVSLIAPTSQARIQEIAKSAHGFIYLVSSMGVTGIRSEISTDLASIVAAIRNVTALPVAVGFGIHTPAQAAQMAAIADGVIVGSALVKIAAEHGPAAAPHIYRYVKEMKDAIR
ncbi:MAG: tryptophan synthase subunit alpha [Treponema sp.]|jgi:tryptophan synthase alpha chain|nr:tryptophan synthase subunit alpha [Treponema sp.]